MRGTGCASIGIGQRFGGLHDFKREREMKQDTAKKEESVCGLKSHHADQLPRKENMKCNIMGFGVVILAVFIPFLLILTSIGPWLVQAVQQTQGIAPKHTCTLTLLVYSTIPILALKKYCPFITKQRYPSRWYELPEPTRQAHICANLIKRTQWQ